MPSGWWHLALNLEPATIAVTQNYVSEANLPKARPSSDGWVAVEALTSGARERRRRCWPTCAPPTGS